MIAADGLKWPAIVVDGRVMIRTVATFVCLVSLMLLAFG